MTILSIDRDKQQIALNYLTISARKLVEACGNYDQAISAIKTMHTYIKLAQEYGCTIAEMTLALGYDSQRTKDLLTQVK